MILKLYKSNISLAVIIIPILAAVLCIPILINDFIPSTYYFNWENELFNFINQHKISSFILTVLFLIANSALINFEFSKSQLSSKITYVPALFYLVLISFKVYILFEPYLILHTVLLLLFRLLMTLEQNSPSLNIAFKSALLIGVLTCFSLYYFVLVIVLYVALSTIKSFYWREWVLPIIGLVIPLLYLFSAQFIFENQVNFGDFKGRFQFQNQFQLIDYIKIGCFLLMTILSISSLLKFYAKNSVINKKRMTILFVFTIMTIIVGLIAFYLFNMVDLGFILPFSILFSISAINNQTDSLLNLLLTITLIVNIAALFIA